MAVLAPGAAPGNPIAKEGGTFYTRAHEPIKVFMSSSYRYRRSTLQSYAAFVGSLWHGKEITRLTIWIATPSQIRQLCGLDESGCYKGDLMLVPGGVASLRGHRALEVIVAHEYGHHIAFHRANDPWDAFQWAPKRWATFKQVCRLVARHRAYPGWETQLHYGWNPGEGWAQAYAFANGYDWNQSIASYWLPASPRAKQVIKNDVLRPWTRDGTRLFSGSLGLHQSARITVNTPLDGTARARLTSAERGFALKLYVGKRLVRTADASAPSPSVSYTVCASRRLSIVVSAIHGRGRFKLVLQRP